MVQSSPEFVAQEGCEFTFSWAVPQACIAAVTNPPPTTNMCGYHDAVSGQTFDFSQLKMDTAFEVGRWSLCISAFANYNQIINSFH